MTTPPIPIIRRHWQCVSNSVNKISLIPLQLLASVLCNPFVQTTEMNQLTRTYYDQMSSTVPLGLQSRWEMQIKKAESERLFNPASMDIMASKTEPRPRLKSLPDVVGLANTSSVQMPHNNPADLMI